jgi:prephenate dehydrogenase
MIDQRVCIAGLGLMGGSLAQVLKGNARYIAGVDRHAATRQQALADGAVDFATESLAAGVAESDLLILALPVRAILDALHELPVISPDGCLVFDLGSTKGAVNEAMNALPAGFAALGGHPMCGKETAGYQAADPALFQGQTFILTRNERTTPEIERLALAIIDLIGAKPLFMAAEQHDRLTAAVSHLPYMLSAALMRYVSGQKDEYLWQTSASGFRDVSRLASSDPQMLLDILLTNKTAVLEQLQGYRAELDKVLRLLAEADEETVAAWLSEAQRRHIAYRQEKEDLE